MIVVSTTWVDEGLELVQRQYRAFATRLEDYVGEGSNWLTRSDWYVGDTWAGKVRRLDGVIKEANRALQDCRMDWCTHDRIKAVLPKLIELREAVKAAGALASENIRSVDEPPIHHRCRCVV